MKIIYNTVLPVVISPCKTWPLGKNLTAKEKGKEFTISSDKEGKKFLKTHLFIEKKSSKMNDISDGIKIQPKSIEKNIENEV